MSNPVLEEYESMASETSSTLESPRISAPRYPVRFTQPLDREVPTTAPQAFSVPSVPYVAYRNPYASQRNDISINVNSNQINSVDPVSSDTRKIRLNMVNQNLFTLPQAGPTALPFNRDTFMSPRAAPPVPPTSTPTRSRAFQRGGVSINVKSKQINSIGLPDFFMSDTREKATDMVNQDVPISAPGFAFSVPVVPPLDNEYYHVRPAPRNPSPVIAVSPRSNQGYFSQEAPRMISPIPTAPPPGQEDLSQYRPNQVYLSQAAHRMISPIPTAPPPGQEDLSQYRPNQGYFPQAAPRMISPIPTVPPPGQEDLSQYRPNQVYLSQAAPRMISPIPTVPPPGQEDLSQYRPNQVYLSQAAHRMISPIPTVPPPGQEDLSQNRPQAAHRMISPIPTVPPPGQEDLSQYRPNQGYFSQAAPRMISPIPTVPPPGQEDLSQDVSRIGSPVQLLPSIRASPKASLVQTFLPFSRAPQIASPMSNAAHFNQDVHSLASRRASPMRPIVTLSPVPCEAEENAFLMPTTPHLYPRLEEVQENDLPVFSEEVPCPNLTQVHEIQESELPAPHQCTCFPTCQENEAAMPFVSDSYIGPCEVTVLPAPPINPPVPQVEMTSNNVKSKQINLIGLSDLVLSDTRRKKLDVLNRLYSLGIHRHIDLPSIVVIGSQNVGKSSLIESISGINLPRSGGACTRCPIECRLVRTTGSEPWQCTVSLRFLTDEHGSPLDLAKNIIFGDIIKDPKDVQERLTRAQLAILNPFIPPELLLDDNTQLEHNSIGYSSNIVSIEIRSPDVTDLTFYDLPGLIACVPEGGRDEDVEDICELVVSYIRKQNCIILLTVACEVDFETQGAYRLAKKCDPEGIRTIGVLTKPDRIPEGEHSRWFKLIRNEISPLQHGWFCVKQLSTVELQKGYSPEKSRHICERFFNKTAPWNTLDAVLCQKRLGTKAVIVKLNELLMSVISERIPDIIQELLKMIQDIRDRIEALPTTFSSNPLFEVVHLVNQFCDTLYNRAEGFDVDSSFFYLGNHFESIRKVQETFREAICETAPKFEPFARDAQLKPCKLGTEMRTAPTPGTMYLDDVSAMALRAVTRELPGFYPFRVVQDLVTCYTDKWKIPAINLINDVFQIVTEHQMRLVRFYFEKYTTGGLYHTVKNLVYGYMQARKRRLEKQMKSLITLESSAFTINNALFLKYKNERLKEHERVRQCYVVADKDDFAMTIITSVEAYFQVAYQRFVDNIPLTIDHNLVRIEKISLQQVLYKGLELMGPNASEHCSKLMAEDTQISGLRAELEGRLKELEAIQTELLDSD